MKVIAVVALALLAYLSTHGPVRAADNCKECREFQRACIKAHSQTACKNDYDICMKHCRQK